MHTVYVCAASNLFQSRRTSRYSCRMTVASNRTYTKDRVWELQCRLRNTAMRHKQYSSAFVVLVKCNMHSHAPLRAPDGRTHEEQLLALKRCRTLPSNKRRHLFSYEQRSRRSGGREGSNGVPACRTPQQLLMSRDDFWQDARCVVPCQDVWLTGRGEYSIVCPYLDTTT